MTMQSFEDFTFTIPAALNSEVIYENKFGFPSIGFVLTVPVGGVVSFQGSFDGVNYDNLTVRSIGLNDYVAFISVSGSFLGSIGSLRSIKFKVTTGGSVAGSVAGRANAYVSTLEGQEHGFPPHKRGFTPIRKDFQFSTAQTGTNLWVPATGKRFIITSWLVFASGTTDADVSMFDQTDSTGNRLFKGFFDITVNSPISANHYLGDSPFISSAVNNILKITTSAAINVFGSLMGYEVEE